MLDYSSPQVNPVAYLVSVTVFTVHLIVMLFGSIPVLPFIGDVSVISGLLFFFGELLGGCFCKLITAIAIDTSTVKNMNNGIAMRLFLTGFS
jgi:hypothetical protein